jgi:O-antigen/teichoic acid export membrane protein
MNQLKSFSIYALTIFLNAAISFATFSLLTHHLNEVDYGIINLYNGFIFFLSPFIAVGVQYTLSIDYFKLDKIAFSKQFTNAIALPILLTVFFTVVFIAIAGPLGKMLGTSFLFTLVIPLICFFTLLNDIFLNLFRNKGKHMLFAGFSIARSVIEVLLTIFFVIILTYKWEGRLGSLLLTLIILVVGLAYLATRWKLFTRKVNKGAMTKIFLHGLPFIPERFAIFILSYSDRFFINHFESTADVGYYSAGSQIAIVMNLITITLINTLHPKIFQELAHSPINYKQLRKTTVIFISASFIAALGIIITIPLFFRYFIGPTFQEGKQYAVFLLIGSFFWAIYNTFLPFLLSSRKNKLIMLISIGGMGLSIALNFFFVPYFGALGATYTSIIVYFFMAIVTIFFVHKLYNLKQVFKPNTN